MSGRIFAIAVSAAALWAASLIAPAGAGTWDYDPGSDLILHESVPVARWYGHRPRKAAGPRHYHDHHPHHVPAYPQHPTGYPVPIYKSHRPLPAPLYRVLPAAHADWCAWRYRSYDVRTDTYQPLRGARRACHSPYR